MKEIAELLKVCAPTVYKMVDRFSIPHIRILNSIRFRRADVKHVLDDLHKYSSNKRSKDSAG